MFNRKSSTNTQNDPSIIRKLIMLFILGISVVFVGIVLLIVAALASDGSDFGVFIFIWPFPIMIGAGSETTWTFLFAMVFSMVSIVLLLILRREMRKVSA